MSTPPKIVKTTDPTILRNASPSQESYLGFNPEVILLDGFCLVCQDDVALFEYETDKVYSGHYFFKSRGKDAIAVAKRFLEYVFRDDAVVIKGLTPVENKAAIWMTRRLGFTMLDIFETPIGRMQLSMLSKKDFK